MVTIYTASLTFNNSTFHPHTVFMCFVWISEQTAIISLYSINWLVCITETQRVYCAVRNQFPYKFQFTFCPPKPVPRFWRSVAGLSTLRPGLNPRPVHMTSVVDKVTLTEVPLPVFRFSPVRIIPSVPHTHLYLHVALISISGRTQVNVL